MFLETQNIVKTYGSHNAVDDVCLHIKKGDIYGLIGKNGAGKTTLMRLLVGNAKPTSGSVNYVGVTEGTINTNTVGSLIEHPGLFANETAFENMRRFMIAFCGKKSDYKQEIIRLLNIVNLDPESKKKVRQFSLGMKQRLGIAVALIGSPSFIILDEPTNGLDPIGMREIRSIVQALNKAGVTFLISSHLIDELSKIATKYGIMSNGKLVEEISAIDLTQKCQSAFMLQNLENISNLQQIPDCDYISDGESVYVFQEDIAHNANSKWLMGAKQVALSIEDYFSMKVGTN